MADQPSGVPEYKHTIFLPQTAFPMRGDLPAREPALLAGWEEAGLSRHLEQVAAGRTPFVLHDGPPYANGHLHIGHALNKIHKDVINRAQRMAGRAVHYVPGWDCHGLPIEWKVEEEYRAAGRDKDQVPVLQFRAECRAYAAKWMAVQADEFRRLGIEGDWARRYSTMDFTSEAAIVAEIGRFLLNGLLYRGLRPVMWSPVEKTALAEAEIEYHEHKSTTIWVRFPLVSGPLAATGAAVAIWTTTPWTMPGNRAIAYGAAFDYVLLRVDAVAPDSRARVGERLLVAEALAAKVATDTGITRWTAERTVPGSELAGHVAAHPLRGGGFEHDVKLLAADFVTTEQGTGFVHVAPGHGEEDFALGVANGLEIPETVGPDGRYNDWVPRWAGLHVFKAADPICAALDERGGLLARGTITHSYPHSWRSRAPLIYRATPQWFIRLDGEGAARRDDEGAARRDDEGAARRDDEGAARRDVESAARRDVEGAARRDGEGASRGAGSASLRRRTLDGLESVAFVPPQARHRLEAMVRNRPDWCISRQRSWGVPIAVFVEKRTGSVLRDAAVMARIVDAFREEGADCWYASPPARFLGPGRDPAEYEQVFDIVDVWFESGSTHAFVLEGRGMPWPADLYLEGSDQHRGWFQSSLLEAVGTRGVPPFRAIVSDGFVLDEHGRKMSKSLGNGVGPQEICDRYGADILRLWVMNGDLHEDLRIGPEILKQQAELYRRLRNTLRWLLGSLNGFDEAERVPYAELPELERVVLHGLAELGAAVEAALASHDWVGLAPLIHNFCASELSAFYFDVRKDALYCDARTSLRRRACRTVLDHLHRALTAWLAPILPFTAEDAWTARFGGTQEGAAESVHATLFPDVPAEWRDPELAERWERIRAVRRLLTAALEGERKAGRFGSSLAAAITLPLSSDEAGEFGDVDWAELAIVSDAVVEVEYDIVSLFGTNLPGAEPGHGPHPGPRVRLAPGAKCARCWRVLPEVGLDATHPALCRRCVDAVAS